MLGNIFLGKFWHWALLAAAVGLLWFCGSKRLHVIEFNLFIISLLLGTIAIVFLIIRFHSDGERITRDALILQSFDPNADHRENAD